MRIAFNIFPTPKRHRITKIRNEKLYKKPRLEFVRIIERERRAERKSSVRKRIFVKIGAGSTKKTVKTSIVQKVAVAISVGRKFFLRLFASFLFSFFMRLYLGYNKIHLWKQ